LCLASAVAHAKGRIPGATGLAIHPTDHRQLLNGLTYGLALSRDGGASWPWMCEEQIEGNGGDVDPSIVVTSDGARRQSLRSQSDAFCRSQVGVDRQRS
jgi:hypothetical protein